MADTTIKWSELDNYKREDVLFAYTNDKATVVFFKDGKDYWLTDEETEEIGDDETIEEVCEKVANIIAEDEAKEDFAFYIEEGGNFLLVSEEAMEQKLFHAKHAIGEDYEFWEFFAKEEMTKDSIFTTSFRTKAEAVAERLKITL